MKKLSVIIPMYGVERYIGDCLDSLYRQDIPEADYEVICVDDCSPDGSSDIVRQYQTSHSNLLLISHERNLRLGAARNTGLKAASGKYVWFVDADDFVKEGSFGSIIGLCENNGLDILSFSYCDQSGTLMKVLEDSDVSRGYEITLAAEARGNIDITYPWNRVSCREFLIENDLWFNDIRGGDVIWLILAVSRASRMKTVSSPYYFYRTDNDDSATRARPTGERAFQYYCELAIAILDCRDSVCDEMKPLMEECCDWRINTAYKSIIKLSNKERLSFYGHLDESPIKEKVLSYAKGPMKLVLDYKYLVSILSPIYRLFFSFILILRKTLNAFIREMIAKKIKTCYRLITHPSQLLEVLFLHIGTDKLFLSFFFRNRMGYWMDFNRPITFNEKLTWLKLNDRNPIYSTMVDKYKVKKYVADLIGEEYVIPALGVWDSFDSINFETLPNQFVLKCTHDSKSTVFVNKNKVNDIAQARNKIKKSLKYNYYKNGCEWPYKNVLHRIIAEPFLVDKSTDELRDYKFFCFNGCALLLLIVTGRFGSGPFFDFYDMDGHYLNMRNGVLNAPVQPALPFNFILMKELAGKLSSGIPHVRVDFYEVNGKVYFGEYTFYHDNGAGQFDPTEWDIKLGEAIDLPI